VRSRSANSRLRILVLGYIVRGPMGGMSWHHLNYLLGLEDLGHDVYFLEHSEDHAWTCFDPRDLSLGDDPTYGLGYLAATLNRLGLGERWAYHHGLGDRWYGPCAERIDELCASADLLLNVSGVNPLRPWLRRVPRRVYIDTDPVFTQLSLLGNRERHAFVLEHTSHLTFATSVGLGTACLPDDRIAWQPTRQPVALRAWPATPGRPHGRLTTVMQWSSYGPSQRPGARYGMKSDSFAAVMELPRRVATGLEVVMLGAAPYALLAELGWAVVDPRDVVPDPFAYRDYLQASKGEFSVAKHGYVVSRSGWFSERSACYLASGRPVVVEDTGFTDWLDSGRGVLAFSTLEEAIEAVRAVDADYDAHCRAAREVAQACFSSRMVLPALLEQALADAAATSGR
jgi:hypothetical protein